MVDRAVNCPGRKPRPRKAGHPADSKDGNFAILSGNGHLIAAPHAAEAVKHSRAVPGHVPGDDGRPKGTWCRPSSEPTSDGRVGRLHLSARPQPKLDQLRSDTDLRYRHGYRIRLRQHRPGDLVSNVVLTRLRRRWFRAGLRHVGRSRRQAVRSRHTTDGRVRRRRSCERCPHERGPDNGQSDGDPDPNESTRTPARRTEQQLRSPRRQQPKRTPPHSIRKRTRFAAAYPSVQMSRI
jgi:hypothetical protein